MHPPCSTPRNQLHLHHAGYQPHHDIILSIPHQIHLWFSPYMPYHPPEMITTLSAPCHPPIHPITRPHPLRRSPLSDLPYHAPARVTCHPPTFHTKIRSLASLPSRQILTLPLTLSIAHPCPRPLTTHHGPFHSLRSLVPPYHPHISYML